MEPRQKDDRASGAPLAKGTVLGEAYEVSDALGSGATGTVYDAVNVETRKRVALKVIHGMLAGDAQVRGRFKREAAILRRLEGPHVCPLLDFGEVPDPRRAGENLLYMALARVDGASLDRWHVTRSNVTMDAILRIVDDVCGALDAAHERGIVHRDLKPSNIMLANGDRAIVVDFGLAKIIAGTGGPGTTALTQHNMVFGTPEYMSPEQARGDAIDGRTDIYSFGIVVYELLTGRTPFTGKSALNVLTAQMTERPDPPSQHAPRRKMGPALDQAVLHALAKDPDARYATAGDFAAALTWAVDHPDDVEGVLPARARQRREDDDAGRISRADPLAATMPDGPRVSDRPASSRPGDSAAPSAPSDSRSSGRGRVEVRVRPPERRPPASRSRPEPARRRVGRSPGAWISVWVITLLVSVGVGVWLAWR